EAFIAGADSTRADPFNAGHTLGAATVHADGATPVNADSGSFNVAFGNVDAGGIQAPGNSLATRLGPLPNNSIYSAVAGELGQLGGYVTIVNAPPLDGALTQQRAASVASGSFQGIAVTATTRDAVSTNASGGGGTGLTPQLSGSSAYITSTTAAFV